MVTFEYDGQQVEIIRSETLTIAELTLVRDAFGIDGLVALDAGLEMLTPDAIRALLVCSLRRSDPKFDPYDEAIDAVIVRPLERAMTADAMEILEAAGTDKVDGD